MTRMHAIDCRECGGDGRLWCQTDVDYWKYAGECPACDGSGAERCCECGEPATDAFIDGKDMTPLCERHMAQYQEDAAA